MVDDGGGCGVCRRLGAHAVGQDRGDALVGEPADLEGSGRGRLRAGTLDVAEQAQHAQACSKALLGVRAGGQDGGEQSLGLWSHRGGPTTEAIRCPFRISPVGTGHVIGIGAMAAPAVSALMGRDPLAAVEDLDRLRGRSDVDLLPDQAVRHRIEEAVELNMVVGADPGKAPFGELVVFTRQAGERGAFDGLEEMAAGDATAAHDVIVDAIECAGDRRVGLLQREERLSPQPAQNAGLGETHAVLDLGFVAWLARPRRQDADAVVRRHHAVAPIDLRIIEAGPIDARLQIVGNDQSRNTVEEAEHAHMGADPIGQCLRPGCLRIGEVGGSENGDEEFGFTDLASPAIDDGDLLAGIVDEDLVAGDVLLAHRRRQPLFETAEEFAEPAVAIAVGINGAVFLPQDLEGDARLLHLNDEIGPARFRTPAHALFYAGAVEELALDRIVGHLARQRPAQPCRRCSPQIVLDGASRHAEHHGDLPGAGAVPGKPKHLSQLSQGQPSLCRHHVPLVRHERA